MARNWSDLSTDAQNKARSIYSWLYALFGNPYGASCIMGNIWIESASTFDGRIIQGQTEATLDTICQPYVDAINNGTISRNQFAHDSQGGGGFGLCQWTWYTRKEGLYDYCFNNGYNNIGLNVMQVQWIHEEMQNGYSSTYNAVITATEQNMFDVTRAVMINYESPRDQSYAKQVDRFNASVAVYNACSGEPPIDPPLPNRRIWLYAHNEMKKRKNNYFI